MPDKAYAFDCPCNTRLYASGVKSLTKTYVRHTKLTHGQYISFEAAVYAIKRKSFIVDDDDEMMKYG